MFWSCLRKHGTKSRVREATEGEQSYGTERAGKIRCARMGQWCAAVFIVWIVSAWQLAIGWTALPREPYARHGPSNGMYQVLLITIVSTFIRESLIPSQSLDHRVLKPKRKNAPLCARETFFATIDGSGDRGLFSRPEPPAAGTNHESVPIGSRARPGFY